MIHSPATDMTPITLAQMRRYAVARSLVVPTTLPQAIQRMGFVQADPIRAPARAQDLVLRHRVKGYRVGDLERRYPALRLEEDFFINYGFVTPEVRALMHPRSALRDWSAERWAQAKAIWDFVHTRGEAHPQTVDAHFQHGHTTNGFGGRSNATTQLMDSMHLRGLLRVVRRESGVRVYGVCQQAAPHQDPAWAMDGLVDVLVALYAPLPQQSLRRLVNMLQHGVPQWKNELRNALHRATERLHSADVAGTRWLWPSDEHPTSARWRTPQRVRLLAPFDPVVWDRDRFERLWGWAYRFEAYTPAAKRQRGYYAMPLLWRDEVIGWSNVSMIEGQLHADVGYVSGHAPADRAFGPALQAELADMAGFLGVLAP